MDADMKYEKQGPGHWNESSSFDQRFWPLHAETEYEVKILELNSEWKAYCNAWRKCNWNGTDNVKRMLDDRLPHRLLNCKPTTSRLPGRPQKCWMDNIKVALENKSKYTDCYGMQQDLLRQEVARLHRQACGLPVTWYKVQVKRHLLQIFVISWHHKVV